MIISLILLVLISILLVLGTAMAELTFSIIIQGYQYELYGGVVILCSILVGIILSIFYNFGKRRQLKQRIKNAETELARLSGELSIASGNVDSLNQRLGQKEIELNASKNELLAALKNQGQASSFSQNNAPSQLSETQPEVNPEAKSEVNSEVNSEVKPEVKSEEDRDEI